MVASLKSVWGEKLLIYEDVNIFRSLHLCLYASKAITNPAHMGELRGSSNSSYIKGL